MIDLNHSWDTNNDNKTPNRLSPLLIFRSGYPRFSYALSFHYDEFVRANETKQVKELFTKRRLTHPPPLSRAHCLTCRVRQNMWAKDVAVHRCENPHEQRWDQPLEMNKEYCQVVRHYSNPPLQKILKKLHAMVRFPQPIVPFGRK